MATLTITVPDAEMADLALAVGEPDADTLAKQKTAATEWLTRQTRTKLWGYQRIAAGAAAEAAISDPMPEEG